MSPNRPSGLELLRIRNVLDEYDRKVFERVVVDAYGSGVDDIWGDWCARNNRVIVPKAADLNSAEDK